MPAIAPPPAPPRAGPSHAPRSIARRSYAFLVSPRFALALLVAVLACCLVGVTAIRGPRAWQLIFSTLWFNALLVTLAISSAAAFFTRTWRRKLTLVSAGMILFHTSFAALLGGVVYNDLFHFKGTLRLTEGETLPNGKLESWDEIERGRFFDLSRLRGETTLLKMHRGFVVDDADKRAAYEIAVADGGSTKTGILYVTRSFEVDGLRFFCSKEGYSVLVVMRDRDGRELYGAHVPLQSLKQPGGGYLYATGNAHAMAPFAFPPLPEEPRAELLVAYRPNTVVERAGDVTFRLWSPGAAEGAAPQHAGTVSVGGSFDAGELTLVPAEIRYWVGMAVRHDPGLNVILASLGVGFGGMVLTLIGRVRQGARRGSAGASHAVVAPGFAHRESP